MAAAPHRPLLGLITTANGISVAGNVLTLVALVTYLFERTGSSLTVAGVVLLGFAPVALMLPLLGPRLAGRPLHSVGAGIAVLQAAVSLAMAAAALATASILVLYLAAATQGILGMVMRVTVLSNLPRLLETGMLTQANLMLQLSSQIGAIVAASGLAARGHASASVLFLIDAFTFALQAAILAAAVPPTPASARAVGEAPAALAPIPAPTPLRAYLVAPAGYVALNLLNVTVPLIVLQRLNAGQRGYALSEVVFPSVAIGAGFLLRRRRAPVPIAPTLLALAASFAISAFATSLGLLLLAVGICGGGMLTSNAATQARIQRDVSAAALPALQSRAAGLGAALSAVGVIGVAVAFGVRADRWALLLCAAWFLWLTGLSLAWERSEAVVEV